MFRGRGHVFAAYVHYAYMQTNLQVLAAKSCFCVSFEVLRVMQQTCRCQRNARRFQLHLALSFQWHFFALCLLFPMSPSQLPAMNAILPRFQCAFLLSNTQTTQETASNHLGTQFVYKSPLSCTPQIPWVHAPQAYTTQ